MKKILIIVLAIILLSLFLVSFDDTGNTDSAALEATALTMDSFDIQLDPDKRPLPSYFALKEIKEGMPYEEVYKIAGLPQRTGKRKLAFGFDNTFTTYFYDSWFGISFEVAFALRQHNDSSYTGGDDGNRTYDEIVVGKVYIVYPENAEYFVLTTIISSVAIVAAVVAFAVIRRKKKNAIASNEPIDKINA